MPYCLLFLEINENFYKFSCLNFCSHLLIFVCNFIWVLIFYCCVCLCYFFLFCLHFCWCFLILVYDFNSVLIFLLCGLSLFCLYLVGFISCSYLIVFFFLIYYFLIIFPKLIQKTNIKRCLLLYCSYLILHFSTIFVMNEPPSIL